MSIICNTNSIRDVIAFPKGLEGKDLLSKAPCEISEEEKNMYHIRIIGEPGEVEAPAASPTTTAENSQRAEN